MEKYFDDRGRKLYNGQELKDVFPETGYQVRPLNLPKDRGHSGVQGAGQTASTSGAVVHGRQQGRHAAAATLRKPRH